MDPLASEDTTNAPGAVSDELIHAENEAIEKAQADDAKGILPLHLFDTRLWCPSSNILPLF